MSAWILSIFSVSPGSVLTVIEWMLLATVKLSSGDAMTGTSDAFINSMMLL